MLSSMAQTVPPHDVAPPAGQAASHGRWRRAALVFLLVLGCGLAVTSVVALWTRATVLNTDRYVKTMAPIARSPAVQKTVADKLDAKIIGAIDFDKLARDVLPDRADVLAPAIQTGAEAAIRQQLDKFVASDRFAQLWDEANRRAHSRVVALLTTGQSKRLTLDGNTVYLDLSGAVDQIKTALTDRGFDGIAAAIPASVDGRIPLLTSDGFSTARRGINVLKGLSIVLPLLMLLAFAGHVLLSDDKRRGLLRVALGLAVSGLLMLAAVGIGRSLYLGAVDQNVLPRQAASDIFDALLSFLRTVLRIAVLVAIVLALVALLFGAPFHRAVEATGPAFRAAGARVADDPRTLWLAEHRGLVQWSFVVFGGLVLVAWSNPSAWVVLIDAVLIGLAVWIVAALARSGHRTAS
jgi:hypothetical protein